MDKNKKMYFVLGVSNPEMDEIDRVLQSRPDVVVGYAAHGKNRVTCASEAYAAPSVIGFDAMDACEYASTFVVAKCSPSWIVPEFTRAKVVVVDNQRHGDPGHGKPPAEYMEASCLGQVLNLLGLKPTPEQRMIAAASYCLAAAYRGECPGVDPEELFRFLIPELRVYEINKTRELVRKAQRVRLAAWLPAVADLRLYSGLFSTLYEAAVKEQTACLAKHGDEVRLFFATPEQIREFAWRWCPEKSLKVTGINVPAGVAIAVKVPKQTSG